MLKILVVDDDITFSKIIESFLKRNGYAIEICHNIENARKQLLTGGFDLVLLDYRLPDGNGIDVLTFIKEKYLSPIVIIMTSFNDVRTAVSALRSGALDYITKPVNQEELLMIISEATAHSNENKKQDDTTQPAFVEGSSAASAKLQREIRLIAPTDMSVIIQGESGTGKEYVARTIHQLSNRSHAPFVAVDCGTLSPELAASELFGHIKGAFTGALNNKSGKFEAANGGTLFLDEIGNLKYEVQVKLLRALQERLITPLGHNKEIKIDIRVIVATNEDLVNAVADGRFREDLYHRLNEFKVLVPALKNRGSDLKLFVQHFIEESNRILHKNVKTISPELYEVFEKHDWPGNIRELKNIVKRLVLLAQGDIAELDDLPEEMLLQIEMTAQTSGTDLRSVQEISEKEMIEKTLIAVKYNKTKAAKILNIDRSTLYAKIEKYNLNS